MLNIRPYQDTDWESICQIHDEARIDELTGSVDLAAFLTLEETAKNEGLFDDQIWVYCLEEKVVGFVAIGEDEVTWLYIDPSHYKKGIGTSLLRFAIDQCGNKITVSVLSENKPAMNLYIKQGFKLVEKRKVKFRCNDNLKAILLILELAKYNSNND